MTTFARLIRDIKACTLCEHELPCAPRPVIQADTSARILIAGQAPGRKVHDSGIPFDDPSGDRFRDWMQVTPETFYDPRRIAIVPMGFCYPGTGKSGDLPPRPECAPAWRNKLLSRLAHIELTLVVGRYAQVHQFGTSFGSVTDCVKSWQDHGPSVIPLPHPSPRNNIWLRRNPWFEAELLPKLRRKVRDILEA